MKTKIVYAITSSEDDYYFEQLLLSVFSLRQHNLTAIVEVVVDRKTNERLDGRFEAIQKYINKKIVIETPEVFNNTQTSRYLKTNLRKFVNGDFLFLDSDTIVTDTLEDIDNFPGDIGAVLNLHVPLDLHTKKDEEKVKSRICLTGYLDVENISYYNSGVIYVKDNELTRYFYNDWYSKWKKALEEYGLYKDQPSFAAVNAEMEFPIKELGGEWNCQVLNNGLPFLFKAKIIHYFASYAKKKVDQPYLFFDSSIYKEIRNNGYISERISLLVDNAKGAFVIPSQIVSGKELNLLSDSLHSLAINHPKVYGTIEIIATLMIKVFRFIRHRK